MVDFLVTLKLAEKEAVDAEVTPPQVEVRFGPVFNFADAPSHDLFGHVVHERVLSATRIDDDLFLSHLRWCCLKRPVNGSRLNTDLSLLFFLFALL